MKIQETLHSLIEDNGVDVLDNHLRLSGFLKDLHPEQEREVFLLSEAQAAGFVNKLRAQRGMKEHQRQELALMLASSSGMAIVHACWAIDIWASVLPEWAYLDKIETIYTGTLEQVLGTRKNR